MSYKFAGTDAPATIIAAKAIVWLQAAVFVVAAMSLASVGMFFGDGASMEFGPQHVSGGSAIGLGIGYLGVGMGLILVGAQLVKLHKATALATVALEVVVAALAIYNGSMTAALFAIVPALIVVILLYLPASREAIAAGTAAADAPAADTPAEDPKPDTAAVETADAAPAADEPTADAPDGEDSGDK